MITYGKFRNQPVSETDTNNPTLVQIQHKYTSGVINIKEEVTFFTRQTKNYATLLTIITTKIMYFFFIWRRGTESLTSLCFLSHIDNQFNKMIFSRVYSAALHDICVLCTYSLLFLFHIPYFLAFSKKYVERDQQSWMRIECCKIME